MFSTLRCFKLTHFLIFGCRPWDSIAFDRTTLEVNLRVPFTCFTKKQIAEDGWGFREFPCLQFLRFLQFLTFYVPKLYMYGSLKTQQNWKTKVYDFLFACCDDWFDSRVLDIFIVTGSVCIEYDGNCCELNVYNTMCHCVSRSRSGQGHNVIHHVATLVWQEVADCVLNISNWHWVQFSPRMAFTKQGF